MPKTTVVNFREDGGDVYVGRPSKWGNPFIVGVAGTRTQVIELHREWIQKQPDLLAALSELKGKRLACFCAPLPCHADTLAELADALDESHG